MPPHPDRLDPALLWARAVVLAVMAVFLGVAGHVTADGLLPGPAVMALLLVVATVLSAALLARPASSLRIVSLLVGSQAAVHVILSATAGHTGDHAGGSRVGGTPPTTSVVPTGVLPTVDGHRVGSLQDAWDSGAASAAHASLPGGHLVSDMVDHAPMMLAHLAAAALVGLWLAVGERCLWTLVALLAESVVRPLLAALALVRGGVPAAPSQRSTASRLVPPRRLADLDRCVVRRGPPLLLCS